MARTFLWQPPCRAPCRERRPGQRPERGAGQHDRAAPGHQRGRGDSQEHAEEEAEGRADDHAENDHAPHPRHPGPILARREGGGQPGPAEEIAAALPEEELECGRLQVGVELESEGRIEEEAGRYRWALRGSNTRPQRCQRCALTS